MKEREYKIIGALDTETTNIKDGLKFKAFPILYQIGILNCDIQELTVSNADKKINISMFREHEKCYSFLDTLLENKKDYVQVILIHNLAFDIYAIAPYLLDKNIKVLARTARKPIALTILDNDNEPVLVFLDTLGLFMKSLARMGEECEMPKAIGDWNYLKIRTPLTPLTSEEINYAKQDIKTLLCYMAYFLKQNPDIDASDIGKRIYTKTGIVRAKRLFHLGELKNKDNKKVSRMWKTHNHFEMPKDDIELFTMHACTRGGFTFCAKNNASKVFECDNAHSVLAVDATSQHPAQMVSHYYPIKWNKSNIKELKSAIRIVENTTIETILRKWHKPFFVSFNARVAFKNLRPKENTIFSREGIYPLASARLFSNVYNIDIEDDTSRANFRAMLDNVGYKDVAINASCNFGKLESCDYCELYITELTMWEIAQCYDYDDVTPISGFISIAFSKPTDFSLLSVMRFYKAKNALKETMQDMNYQRLQGLFPDSFITKIKDGTVTKNEMKEYYFLAKADLNALFGIEATNECKQDFILNSNGLEITGEPGLENMPQQPRCWYQFGQRIVGYSRIAQIVAMQLIAPYAENIICGDTDSLKIYIAKENIFDAEKALLKIGYAIDKAKAKVCKRVRDNYPLYFDELENIGYYVNEGEFNYFCASWNKSYIYSSDGKNLNIVLAGVPTEKGETSIKNLAENWLNNGASFADVANKIIGYNVTYDYSLTRLNGRKPPAFAEMFSEAVTDYLGNTTNVYAPCALALYPELKTIGDSDKIENAINLDIALKNNPGVNSEPIILTSKSNYDDIMCYI